VNPVRDQGYDAIAFWIVWEIFWVFVLAVCLGLIVGRR
jgi:hypothetical protein